MRRPAVALASSITWLVLLTACGGGEGAEPDADAAPAAASIEESWSLLFADVNASLRGDQDSIAVGAEECLTGDHGARLTVEHRASGFVYGFGRACGLEQAVAVLNWPDGLLPEVVRGERVIRTVEAAYAEILDNRVALTSGDLDRIVEAAERGRSETGVYPAGMDDGALGELDLWPSEALVTYAPSADRTSFRVCVQSVPRGPWESYDSARGGPVSSGDTGRCSFRAPPRGSLREVRRDLRALVLLKNGPEGFGCKRLPTDADLRTRGVLAKGNRVAGCERISWQEGAVHTETLCVQHGSDGAWATYDEAVGTIDGEDGTCDLRPEKAQRGPYVQ